MLYQLPNGRVIELSTEQYFQMTDDELEYLIAYNFGDNVEDPWFGSVIHKSSRISLEEGPPEIITDLTDISMEDKISYTDIDYKPEED